MAPQTRSAELAITPNNTIERKEATTTTKTRCFQAYDDRHEHEPQNAIAQSKTSINKQPPDGYDNASSLGLPHIGVVLRGQRTWYARKSLEIDL